MEEGGTAVAVIAPRSGPLKQCFELSDPDKNFFLSPDRDKS